MCHGIGVAAASQEARVAAPFAGWACVALRQRIAACCFACHVVLISFISKYIARVVADTDLAFEAYASFVDSI